MATIDLAEFDLDKADVNRYVPDEGLIGQKWKHVNGATYTLHEYAWDSTDDTWKIIMRRSGSRIPFLTTFEVLNTSYPVSVYLGL